MTVPLDLLKLSKTVTEFIETQPPPRNQHKGWSEHMRRCKAYSDAFTPAVVGELVLLALKSEWQTYWDAYRAGELPLEFIE